MLDRILQFCIAGGIVGGIALGLYYRKHDEEIEYQKVLVYCRIGRDGLDRLSQHGPFIEACAGSGYLSHHMRKRGMEALAFDRYKTIDKYGPVTQAKNGTFEHQYPDHTLLIVNGMDVITSIRKYSGKKVIIGGYHFVNQEWDPSRRTNYDLRPSTEVMKELGFELVEEWENPRKEGPNINICFRVYVR